MWVVSTQQRFAFFLWEWMQFKPAVHVCWAMLKENARAILQAEYKGSERLWAEVNFEGNLRQPAW